jgi:uncharacterized C2H2 Zn-finger protein
LFFCSCELCGEEFKTSVNKARDKSVHLLGHFREEVMKHLPRRKPYKCPKCTFTGRDISDLSRHFGLSHRIIFSLMQKELGECWQLDENETNDCQVCGQVFANSRVLNDHYCAQHFYQKLAEGLPTTSPFKCPQCNFQSKTQLALVRHVGAKHRQIKKLLQEDGISAEAAGSLSSDAKSRSSSTSQDAPASPAFADSSEPEIEPQAVAAPQEPPPPVFQQPLEPPHPPPQQQPPPQPTPVLQTPPIAVNPYEQPWQQQQQQPVEQRPTPHHFGAYHVASSPYHQPQYTQAHQQLPPQQQLPHHYPPEHHPGYATQQQQTYQNFPPHQPQQQQVLIQHPIVQAPPQQQPHIDHHHQQQLHLQQQQTLSEQHHHVPQEPVTVIKEEPQPQQQQQQQQLQQHQHLYKPNSNTNSNKADPLPVISHLFSLKNVVKLKIFKVDSLL